MTTSPCDDEAMRSLLGFLALGRLSAAEHRAVTEHLASCPSCRAERDQVDRVVSVLGSLSVADVQALVAEFGTAGPAEVRPAGEQLFGAPGAPRPIAAPAAPRPAPPPRKPQPMHIGEGALRPRPRTGPLARGPHSHRPGEPRRRRAIVAAVVTGAVAVVLSTVLLLNPWTPADRLGPVVAVAAARDESSGVDVSATIYAGDGKVRVRLATQGLGLGVYQLYAVTEAGEDLLLGRLSGAAGQNAYSGDVPVPVDDLWYFSLRQVDGPLMVVAPITKGSVPKKSDD